MSSASPTLIVGIGMAFPLVFMTIFVVAWRRGWV